MTLTNIRLFLNRMGLILFIIIILIYQQSLYAQEQDGKQQNIQTSTDRQLKLNQTQHQAMGMKTQIAQVVTQVPSNIYPAQGAIPLKTIRRLSSPLSGQITQLKHIYGRVKKGQIIAEIETPELLKIQAQLLSTWSDLNIAQKSLKRARTLNKSGVSSTKKLQQAKLEVKKLQLKKNQIKQQLVLLGMAEESLLKLENSQNLQPAILQLKSPIDGQLFNLQVHLGERVTANQEILSVGAINPITLLTHVPIKMANRLSTGQAVEIMGLAIQGMIEYITPQVDPMTQSVDVHIQVNNDAGKFRVGQLFNVRFLNTDKQSIFQIPSDAISYYQGVPVIFVIAQQQARNTIIQALPIQVINIAQGKMFFTPKGSFKAPMAVYISGSSAIKSALAAAL